MNASNGTNRIKKVPDRIVLPRGCHISINERMTRLIERRKTLHEVKRESIQPSKHRYNDYPVRGGLRSDRMSKETDTFMDCADDDMRSYSGQYGNTRDSVFNRIGGARPPRQFYQQPQRFWNTRNFWVPPQRYRNQFWGGVRKQNWGQRGRGSWKKNWGAAQSSKYRWYNNKQRNFRAVTVTAEDLDKDLDTYWKDYKGKAAK